jgi:hypothetical protein
LNRFRVEADHRWEKGEGFGTAQSAFLHFLEFPEIMVLTVETYLMKWTPRDIRCRVV